MAVDLTKLVFHSNYPAFKNNREYTGTLSITGSTSGGTNTRTFDIALDTEPDLLDVIFNGNSNSPDARPDDAWFKNGEIWVPTNNAGGGNPSRWRLTYEVEGTTLTVTATYIQQFVTGETLTSTDFSYKIVDYSVF